MEPLRGGSGVEIVLVCGPGAAPAGRSCKPGPPWRRCSRATLPSSPPGPLPQAKNLFERYWSSASAVAQWLSLQDKEPCCAAKHDIIWQEVPASKASKQASEALCRRITGHQTGQGACHAEDS